MDLAIDRAVASRTPRRAADDDPAAILRPVRTVDEVRLELERREGVRISRQRVDQILKRAEQKLVKLLAAWAEKRTPGTRRGLAPDRG